MSDDAQVVHRPTKTDTIWNKQAPGLRFRVRSGLFGKLTLHADAGLAGDEATAAAICKYCAIHGLRIVGRDESGRVTVTDGCRSDYVAAEMA